MSRVLLLGGSGQVGRAVQHLAPAGLTVIAPASADVDLRDAASIERFVSDTKPECIINCAAFTRVDDAETETVDATAINAEAPRVLAEAAVALGARLVHVSTDYVFGNGGDAPFAANAPVSPLNAYGRTKLAGEQAVVATDPNAVVVRTAWVHSGGGVNFVATAVRVLRKGGVMRVVDDQVSTPTHADSLAGALLALAAERRLTGVVHFTDAGVASWYDVADCVLETLQRAGQAGYEALVVPVESRAFPRPAMRPRVSLLDKHATWAALRSTPPHWRVGVIRSTLELVNA